MFRALQLESWIDRATYGRAPRIAVGWVTADTLRHRPIPIQRLGRLESSLEMRIGNNARALNSGEGGCWNELYVPGRRYDIVVFFKAMDSSCQTEAQRIQEQGGKVIFEANVNYFESWGEFPVAGTRPTPQQQNDVLGMSQLADHVVADSSYLASVAQPSAKGVTWIPDNVGWPFWQWRRLHRSHPRLRLIWCGIAQKAKHLEVLMPALQRFGHADLTIVSDRPPEILRSLERVVPVRFIRYSEVRYARLLSRSDAIISPKFLTSSYEIAHTEYKITLGMAAGLPAVASRQQSYVEALEHGGGGILVDSPDEWCSALERLLSSVEYRRHAGQCARNTVEALYTPAVTAKKYLDLFSRLN